MTTAGKIVAAVGLALVSAGLYLVWFGLSHILEAMATGNLASVLGWALIGYIGGTTIVIVLLGVGIALIALGLDD